MRESVPTGKLIFSGPFPQLRETHLEKRKDPMSKSLRVLLAEDHERTHRVVVRRLCRGGYNPFCRRVETPEAFWTV